MKVTHTQTPCAVRWFKHFFLFPPSGRGYRIKQAVILFKGGFTGLKRGRWLFSHTKGWVNWINKVEFLCLLSAPRVAPHVSVLLNANEISRKGKERLRRLFLFLLCVWLSCCHGYCLISHHLLHVAPSQHHTFTIIVFKRDSQYQRCHNILRNKYKIVQKNDGIQILCLIIWY